jgi:hypothetical protein
VPPRLKALFLLAWALIRTVFRRMFTNDNDGIRRFVENYAADRLPPVSPEERERLMGFGRCIACGLCDRGEGARIVASGGTYRGVMSLMLAASRSMPDFDAAALSFAHVPDEVLAEKEAICPTAVPMRKIAHFVQSKARELERSMPPTSVRSLPPLAKKL